MKRTVKETLFCRNCYEELAKVSEYYVGLIKIECPDCGADNYFNNIETMGAGQEY